MNIPHILIQGLVTALWGLLLKEICVPLVKVAKQVPQRFSELRKSLVAVTKNLKRGVVFSASDTDCSIGG